MAQNLEIIIPREEYLGIALKVAFRSPRWNNPTRPTKVMTIFSCKVRWSITLRASI